MNAHLQHQEDVIVDYYKQTESQYKNWGSYTDMPLLYAMHSGFYPHGDITEISQRESIAKMDEQIIKWLSLPSDETIKVLDLGCGTGVIGIKIALSNLLTNVHGITLAPNHGITARRFVKLHGVHNFNIVIGNYLNLPYPTNFADRAMFIESLMHAAEPMFALREAFRVLKPGGFLHFQEPLLNRHYLGKDIKDKVEIFLKGYCEPTLLTYPLESFVDLWKEIGFTDIAVSDLTYNIFPSAKIIGDHAEMRMNEKTNVSDPERTRRQGAIYLRDLMLGFESNKNALGYYVVQGRKP